MAAAYVTSNHRLLWSWCVGVRETTFTLLYTWPLLYASHFPSYTMFCRLATVAYSRDRLITLRITILQTAVCHKYTDNGVCAPLSTMPWNVWGRGSTASSVLNNKLDASEGSWSMGAGVLSRRQKRQGREVDHSRPSGAKVKNEWRYTSTPLYMPSKSGQGGFYLLPLPKWGRVLNFMLYPWG